MFRYAGSKEVRCSFFIVHILACGIVANKLVAFLQPPIVRKNRLLHAVAVVCDVLFRILVVVCCHHNCVAELLLPPVLSYTFIYAKIRKKIGYIQTFTTLF